MLSKVIEISDCFSQKFVDTCWKIWTEQSIIILLFLLEKDVFSWSQLCAIQEVLLLLYSY